MLQAVLSWLGESKYQADVVSDDPADGAEAYLLVQVYETLYNLGVVPIGEPAVVTVPDSVPYGPMRVGAVTAAGAVTPRWTHTIHEGEADGGNFVAQLRRRSLATHPMPHRITGYRMRIDVTSTRGLSPAIGNAIFLFRKNRDDSQEDRLADEFMCVCHPGDLEEYPRNDPEPDGVFFRKNYIDVVGPSPIYMASFWRNVKNDVDRLMYTLECNARLGADELVLCTGRASDG